MSNVPTGPTTAASPTKAGHGGPVIQNETTAHPASRLLPRLLRILGLCCAIILVAMLIALVLLPRLMGWLPLTVLSGSMEPAIPVGSQVVVDRVETEEELANITTGDVITFMPEPDDPTLVTHRVISQGIRGEGDIALKTRGDANDADDPGTVTLQQIRGVSRYHVPYVGYVASLLDAQQKRTGTIVVALILFGYAGWNIVAALRDRRHDKPTPDTRSGDETRKPSAGNR